MSYSGRGEGRTQQRNQMTALEVERGSHRRRGGIAGVEERSHPPQQRASEKGGHKAIRKRESVGGTGESEDENKRDAKKEIRA